MDDTTSNYPYESLRIKHKNDFDTIMEHYNQDQSAPPLNMIIQENIGIEKSYLIGAIHELLEKWYIKYSSLLLRALTIVIAFHIA